MDNETRYELKLDAKDFISQLNQILEVLRRIDGIITQQGGKKFAIDVQIKNADILRVAENFAKTMQRANGDAEKVGASIERALGKNKSLDRASKSMDNFGKAATNASKRINDISRQTADAITNVYKKNQSEVNALIKKNESSAKQSAQVMSAAYITEFRKAKRELESAGFDTSKMSPQEMMKFWKNAADFANKRKVGQDIASNFREGWEKSLTSLNERLNQVAEKNGEKQGRMIEAQARKYESQMRLAEERIQKMREAAAEKERQRELRQRLYRRNVAEASRMLIEQVAQESSPEEQKLMSKYNRAVQRIRGIYQSAVEHGRVENPETILAGLTELQQRSLALNNYRLSDQMGINELNEKLKTTVRRFEEMGTRLNKFSSVIQNSVQAFATLQSFAYRITSTFTRFARTTLSRIVNQVSTLTKESTEAFKSLEVSLIGFRNFFGEEQTDRLYQRIKAIAAQAPGLATTDLADYVRQIAPVSGHDANLALNASLGMLKTIQYGGASGSTEMEYVIKNIRDVLSKGKATAIDIRQFNRAMPILEEVLESVGQSQLLKDGVLTIDKDNVDTILYAFAELNTSNQSAVKDIFAQMNKTLSGQWEQFREQFTTNLMEALRGSGVYGGVQNFLSQVNEGMYVNDALARLQVAISNFINGINWFKVQRVATELWDGLKIIWEGVKDAAENIMNALGRTRSGNIISAFSKWIADLIRGMSDGIAQVIKFVQYLERSGIMNGLARTVGWLGSVGAVLTKVLGTMFSHLVNISGNIMQLISRYTKLGVQKNLSVLSAQLDAIPITARSQVASGADLLYGTGIASNVSPEVGAINSLASMVNAHLSKIEMNQTGASTLPKVAYGKNNGKSFFYSEDYQGYEAVGTWNEKTKSWDMHGFSNKGEGAAEYQRLTTQNRLQASNSAFLQRIGNNKYVDATLKWIKTAGQKILAFTQKLIGNLFQGGIALMVTQSITGIIESMEVFGDATTAIAGIVRSAGYAITGALVGKTFGGVTGGVVGAIIGLGVGIGQLVQTIKEKDKDLKNMAISESLDDAEKAMRDQTVALLQQYGFTVDKESVVGAGALHQLDYYIKSTPVANRSTEEAVRYYNEAYKMLSVGYALKNFAESSEYGSLGGSELNLSNTSNELFKSLASMVRKYGLAEGQGYYYGEGAGGRSYYRDENFTEEIPAEELLKNAFPNGVTDEQARALLEKANKLDEDYGKTTIDKLENLLRDNTGFKTALDRIDQNVADILRNVVDFLGKATPENLGQWYGEPAKTQAESFESHANGWERFLALMGVNSFEYQNEGYGTERGMDKVYYPNVRSKLGQEFDNAVDTGDSERAGYLGDWINKVDSYEFGGYSGWLKDWISFLLEKLTDYNNKFGRNFRFAHGGIVPAFAPMGVDTVPAMLSPGEFVMKPSVVKKAGLGVMHALNRGDLGAAARSLAQNVSNRTWNRNNTSNINSRTTNYNTNNFHIMNRNTSARMNSYYSLANRLAF